jgi:signal transduction histidine kinase
VGALGLGFTDITHPDDRQANRARVSAILTGEVSAYTLEKRYLRKDGHIVWVSIAVALVRDPEGRPAYFVGILKDITASAQAEAAMQRFAQDLLRLNGELDARVAERSRELEVTQSRLAHAQHMQALGQLAGGIAHDFNNILQAVQGAAALIERRIADADRVRGLARMVIDAAGRGAAITGRLLAFSRRGNLRTEPMDAAALLGTMQEILSHTLGAGITVQVALEPGLPPLLADKRQLETVLVNLATNARDAIAGSGTIVIAATLDAREHTDAGVRAHNDAPHTPPA